MSYNKTTYSRHTSFTEDEVLVLPGGADPNSVRWVFAVEAPHAGGRRSMITSLISRLDFREWSGTGWSAHYYRTNGQSFQESVAMLQDAHRGAGSNNTTHRPVDFKTGVIDYRGC